MYAILIVRAQHYNVGCLYMQVGRNGRPDELPVLRGVTDDGVRQLVGSDEILLSFDFDDPLHPVRYGNCNLLIEPMSPLIETRVYVIKAATTPPRYLPAGQWRLFSQYGIEMRFEPPRFSIARVFANAFLQAAKHFGQANLYLPDPLPPADTVEQYCRVVRVERFYHWIEHGECYFSEVHALNALMQALTLQGPPEPRFARLPSTEECCICLMADTNRMLVCRHGFHAKCLDTWKNTATRANPGRVMRCPYCRGEWTFAMVLE